MEINIRQRVIGGVVLIALAVIFVPLLFKSHARPPRHVTLETSIPAAPAKPSMQTTITMQGEELNPQRNIVETAQAPSAVTSTSPNANVLVTPKSTPNTIPAPSSTTNISRNNPPVQQMQMQEQQPIEPTPAQTAQKSAQQSDVIQAEANESKPKQTANKVAKSSKPALKTVSVQEQALLEPADNSIQTAKSTDKQHAKAKKLVTVKTASKTNHKDKSKVAAITATKSQHAKLESAKAWAIQLGSFGDAKKAKNLEKQLRAKGYIAYTRQVKTSIGTMTRVYVGPEVKRQKADTLLANLDTNMHLKGVVIPFSPTQTK